MPLNKTSMRDKIITKLQAVNADMTAADIAIMEPLLEAFCDGIIEEIQQNGNITMDPGDFNVLPGSFQDSTSTPITGQGDNAAFDLTGKIN